MDFGSKYPLYESPNQRFSLPRDRRIRGPGKLVSAAAVILGLGIVLTILNIYELHKMKEDHALHIPMTEAKTGVHGSKQPIVWVEGKNLHTGYLKHVFAVFDRVGYVVKDGDSQWDVLWSHEYPFETFAKELSDLRPHQRINHFPGTGYISNKVSLATSSIPFIPRAFKIPKDKEKFIKFATEHPNKLWVQKRNTHRGIKIKQISELDLTNDGSFVQEYIDKPFLINKKKFDIGVYTTLTSIDPLRVYIEEEEVLFRFCTTDYYPFDAKNTKKYVVEDNYTPMWEIPSLKKLYDETMYTYKETFDAYLQQKGKNHTKLWEDVRKAITMVYLQKEKNLISSTSRFRNTRNFFEMVRFDFVLDEDLNVYLMEVNMSPNLSSGHFSRNKALYEHVIFNMLGLVGVAKSVTNPYENSNTDVQDMRASDRDITVFPDWCSSSKCQTNCQAEKCILCHQCLTMDWKRTLKYAYLEHHHRGSTRRVFPPSVTPEKALKWNPSNSDEVYKFLNKKNKMIYMWFVGKCRLDHRWCY